MNSGWGGIIRVRGLEGVIYFYNPPNNSTSQPAILRTTLLQDSSVVPGCFCRVSSFAPTTSLSSSSPKPRRFETKAGSHRGVPILPLVVLGPYSGGRM